MQWLCWLNYMLWINGLYFSHCIVNHGCVSSRLFSLWRSRLGLMLKTNETFFFYQVVTWKHISHLTHQNAVCVSYRYSRQPCWQNEELSLTVSPNSFFYSGVNLVTTVLPDLFLWIDWGYIISLSYMCQDCAARLACFCIFFMVMLECICCCLVESQW